MSRPGPPAPQPRDPGLLETAIGHRFTDRELLELALTHRSRSGGRNNERLEFLGDAFLGFVVAEELYRRHPRARENELTLIRASLVREATLAELARGLELDEYLLFGPQHPRQRCLPAGLDPLPMRCRP
ncbi:MAG: ribonuclease III domain-containing protein [Gammaproteobacteria bacterium]|nr:ribonuclease III domain-containing protein [Gammaproteobacteria bacterium]